MFAHVNKIKNKVCALLSAFLCSAGVLVYASTPVYASSQSVGSIDYDSIESSQLTIDLGTGVSAYYIAENTSELIVPVNIKLSSLNNVYQFTYLSGYARYNIGLNLFGYDTNSPVNVNPYYFEPVNGNDFRVVWTTAGQLRVYFDNFRIEGSNALRYINIGYIHYFYDVPSTGFTYTFPNVNRTGITCNTSNVRGTAYEYGFVEAMVYSINNATSIQQIFQVLNDIDQNTGYLADILAELQDTHSELYYLIAQVWNTDTAILSVERDTYNAVLDIFALLNNQFGQQESHAEEVIGDVEQNMANLAHDIELTKPSAVADIADDYIQQIDTSYNTYIFGSLFNPIIILMLCLVFALAILSYMLFGGQ